MTKYVPELGILLWLDSHLAPPVQHNSASVRQDHLLNHRVTATSPLFCAKSHQLTCISVILMSLQHSFLSSSNSSLTHHT